MRTFVSIILVIMMGLPATATALGTGVHDVMPEFHRIGNRQGLSNSQVNCIMKDSRGFVWFGTASGLNRFDGMRFKKFFSRPENERSLKNDVVNALYEDGSGRIWVGTLTGYCLYDPRSESFDQHPERWMREVGMEGNASLVFVDEEKNLYVVVRDRGLYFYQEGMDRARLMAFGGGRNAIPKGTITSIDEVDGTVVMAYNDGTLARVDAKNNRVMWVNRYLPEHGFAVSADYSVHVDHMHNYWVGSDGLSMVYSSQDSKWYPTVSEWLRARGIAHLNETILVKDVAEDGKGRIWIATDHAGLLEVDVPAMSLRRYMSSRDDAASLPDNTLQSLMLDDNGALWIGTYKNGAAYYNENAVRFPLLAIGDVCTITEDRLGCYWMGTNDRGIVCYNPLTGGVQTFGRQVNRLGSNVVVSSLCSSDGSLWFGSYNGGMVRYKGGVWTAYNTENGLKNNHVWSLAEDRNGYILVGTLGGGLQVLDPATGKFGANYTENSAGLSSDYIASLFVCKNNDLLLGHSQNYSLIKGGVKANGGALKDDVVNNHSTRSGTPFSNPAVNQIMQDSRGLIWIATSSGVNIYDSDRDQLAVLNEDNGLEGMAACSVLEDRKHDVWVVTDGGLSRVSVTDDHGRWQFSLMNYNEMDGLQERQFNYRSVMLASNGDVVVGGQDGINIVPFSHADEHQKSVSAVFSGLVLFDHPLSVGEEYNGKVVLKEAINESRQLDLEYFENAFTVQLAVSDVVYPPRRQFRYRLLGLNEHWMRTHMDRGEVTFTNLSPGRYRLQVQVIDRFGNPYDEISELRIVIHPPFYASVWAILLYILLGTAALLAALWWLNHRQKVKLEREREQLERERERLEVEQLRSNAEKERELDEMKMQFYTNASHELRTPLTLIISPLSQMVKNEDDDKKRGMLEIIHRNASHLLTLVNQLLDFRKLDEKMERLNLVTGDMVDFVHSICNAFILVQDKDIKLSFSSSVEHQMMSFDDDKIRKVVNNLLSNAYKYTGQGGHVDVHISVVEASAQQEEMVHLSVSDTGIGVKDEEKQHIFDRFYRVRRQTDGLQDGHNIYGSSGVGLSLVKDFVELHDGTITVGDRKGGGTVFDILLPIRLDAALRQLVPQENAPLLDADTHENQPAEGKNSGMKSNYEVMIVDDSEDFLTFMAEVLSSDYRVKTARNGKEALTMILEKSPDLILSDVMMPVMDGLELCKTLKRNPATRSIPFVMLTARMAQEQKIEGMEVGADDYITKPFNIDLLNLRIRNLMKWCKGGGTEKWLPQAREIEITSEDEKMVRKATLLVEKNMANTDFSVEMLSAELGMSRVNLYKKLLSITGSTPSEFIRVIRLQRAGQLLQQSGKTVSEIAYDVGFNNPRYFSKYFKELYGMMPSEYKEAKC